MESSGFFANVLFRLGPLTITDTVVTTWAIMALLWLTAWTVTRRLQLTPGRLQTVAEAVVSIIETSVKQLLPVNYGDVTPFIMALWIFLVLANLTGLIPGLHSPTRDLSLTAGLAVLVFLSVHWFGIRSQGLKRYLQHYLSPSPLLLP
ncbi:MAG: F0F1 ATP synthase subunit A, partial [Pseudomonadota bacterium]